MISNTCNDRIKDKNTNSSVSPTSRLIHSYCLKKTINQGGRFPLYSLCFPVFLARVQS